jgi:hypothetical protein
VSYYNDYFPLPLRSARWTEIKSFAAPVVTSSSVADSTSVPVSSSAVNGPYMTIPEEQEQNPHIPNSSFGLSSRAVVLPTAADPGE